MVLADLGALPATGAARLIHHRDQDARFFALLEHRSQEQVSVVCLHVTIPKKRRRGLLRRQAIATPVLPVLPLPLATATIVRLCRAGPRRASARWRADRLELTGSKAHRGPGTRCGNRHTNAWRCR
jgi:hypothetical protein